MKACALVIAALWLAGEASAAAPKASGKTKKKPAATAKSIGPETPPAGSSPLADLKASNAALKKAMRNNPPSWSPERDIRNSEVRKLVSTFLDFEELSRRALGKHWDGLSLAQRADFAATLRDLVERNYVKQIHGQPDYDLRFDQEEKKENEAKVTATLSAAPKGPKAKKVSIALEYHMVYKGGRWVVYDVVTDEQSMLENYRAEFGKIITKDGFDALVKRMKKRLQDAG